MINMQLLAADESRQNYHLDETQNSPNQFTRNIELLVVRVANQIWKIKNFNVINCALLFWNVSLRFVGLMLAALMRKI